MADDDTPLPPKLNFDAELILEAQTRAHAAIVDAVQVIHTQTLLALQGLDPESLDDEDE